MLRRQIVKFIGILLIVTSSAGCALAMADKALGDKKATHADDQAVVNTSNPDGNNFSKDAQ